MTLSRAPEGWRRFVDSPLGRVAAVLAMAATAAVGLAPDASPIESLAQFLLAMIALGCVAVLAFRSDPAVQVARVEAVDRR